MTRLVVGVVDVFVLARAEHAWRVLVLRRAPGTRCPGSWETVHGHIEDAERPEDAAIREVREETGLAAERLYNVIVQPFYLHAIGTVELAVVFAAIVDGTSSLRLGPEHDQAEWLGLDGALNRLVWPRERSALRDVAQLLAGGDAGTVEDVLRVRPETRDQRPE